MPRNSRARRLAGGESTAYGPTIARSDAASRIGRHWVDRGKVWGRLSGLGHPGHGLDCAGLGLGHNGLGHPGHGLDCAEDPVLDSISK